MQASPKQKESKWLTRTRKSSRSRQSRSGAATPRTTMMCSQGSKPITRPEAMTTLAASSEADRGSLAEDAGSVYADFIEKELDDQRASKTSMEQRAVAVVTTAGVLVTLLFGFASLA